MVVQTSFASRLHNNKRDRPVRYALSDREQASQLSREAVLASDGCGRGEAEVNGTANGAATTDGTDTTGRKTIEVCVSHAMIMRVDDICTAFVIDHHDALCGCFFKGCFYLL